MTTYTKTTRTASGFQYTNIRTVEPSGKLVIIRCRTDGILLPYTSTNRRSARFPRLLAWRIGRKLRAGGYAEDASV